MIDVVIIGGGPAGLSAALILGRARKRVLLVDTGTPRNAAAARVHGFVTQDGTPPKEFRRIAKEQLRAYPSVEIQDTRAETIEGQKDAFRVTLSSGVVEARRVVLCVGMVDFLPELPGLRALWGKSVFVCPYCHGWEVRDRPFACLVPAAEWLNEWPLFLANWSKDLIVFTNNAYPVPDATREKLTRNNIQLEERRIIGLQEQNGALSSILLEGGEVRREVLFARPTQQQTSLVASLGLTLNAQGFVQVDEFQQTSTPGIYAAGDLTTMQQAALVAAAAGAQAAYRLNHELVMSSLA